MREILSLNSEVRMSPHKDAGGGGSRFIQRQERKQMVEWALERGYWNLLTLEQRVVLELRYRPDNPLSHKSISETMGKKGENDSTVSVHPAFKRIAKLKRRQDVVDKAKIDGTWDRLTATQKRVFDALYGPSPKTHKQVALEFGNSVVTIGQVERLGFKRIFRASVPKSENEILLNRALESGVWNNLSSVQRVVLEQRFGPRKASQTEIAQGFGFSRQAVSETEIIAFKRIKKLLYQAT